MAVYESKRQPARSEFLNIANELEIYTITNVSRFPKSYRYSLTNEILKLSNEVHEYVHKANAIFVHKNMSEDDFKMRSRFITAAKSSLVALSGRLSIAFKIVDKGNNFYAGKSDYSKVFQSWIDLVNKELDLLKGLSESDKKRYKEYQKQKQGS